MIQRLSLSLAAALTLAGCDEFPTENTPSAAELADDDPAVGALDDEADEDDDAEDLDPVDPITATTPEPSAAYGDCKESGAFCFWTKANYVGAPSALPKGDFAIKFTEPVWSMLKRNGTYRVKLFGNDNFTGNCAVFGPADVYAASPKLPFGVRSARRMEPTEKGCP